MIGKIENSLERGFVKHRLNCLLITDPMFPEGSSNGDVDSLIVNFKSPVLLYLWKLLENA